MQTLCAEVVHNIGANIVVGDADLVKTHKKQV